MIYTIGYKFIHTALLKAQIEQAMGITLTSVNINGDIEIDGPEGLDTSILQSIVNSHIHPGLAIIKPKIESSIEFGRQMIIDFSAENVLMGITEYGKTRTVHDYLSKMLGFINAGSLKEATNEVDRLIFLGLPDDLRPFITLQRLELFKSQLLTYLGGL